MKNPIFLALFLLLAAGCASSKNTNTSKAAHACREKVTAIYNVDMMNIEGREISKHLSHSKADQEKKERHIRYVDELKDCEDLQDQ